MAKTNKKYIDFSAADDNGSGTYADPWKLVPGMLNANNSITDDTTYYLKRGEHWKGADIERNIIIGSEYATGVEFSSYYSAVDGSDDTSQPLPIIDTRLYLRSVDWTQYGGGSSTVWSTVGVGTDATGNGINIYLTTPMKRCFFDNVGQVQASSIANVGVDGDWFYDDTASTGDVLYVNSGSSTQNPSQIYEVTVTSQGRCGDTSVSPVAHAGSSVFRITSATNIKIENIRMYGSNGWAQVYAVHSHGTRVCGGFDIRNNELMYMGSRGIWFKSDTELNPTSNAITGPNYIGYNNIDYAQTQLEKSGDLETVDGITLDSGCEDFIVERNRVRDFGHNCISVLCFQNAVPTVRNVVRFNDVSTPIQDYGRGLGCGGLKTRVIDNVFYGNWTHDCPTQAQFEGKNTLVMGNIFQDMRVDFSDNGASGHISSAVRDTADIDGVYIINNVLIDSWDAPIRFKQQLVGYNIDLLVIANNIIIQRTGASEPACIQYEEGTSGTYTTINVHNNVLISADTNDVIDWNGTPYTKDEAESNVPSVFDGNLETEPDWLTGYNASYEPSDYPPDTDLFEAGTFVSFSARDYNGRPFHNPPTIGAFEFTSGCPTATTRGNATSRSNASSRSAVSGTRTTREGC